MKPSKPNITRRQILACLRYDDDRGRLVRVSARNPLRVGEVAGTVIRNGYRSVVVCGCRLYAHRIVWFLHHGEWPECDIDHVDRNRDNNRIGNLRLAVRSENNINSRMPKNNTSGFKGAYFDKRRDQWASEIWDHKKKRFLGYFGTAEQAGAAYAEAARKHYGDFATA